MTMTETMQKYRWPALIALAIATGVFLSMYIVQQRMQTFEANSRVQLAEQQALLSTIAETTARNGADSITESIVRDCSIDDRSRFDTLLGSLDSGLPRYELIELERLYLACGNFYAERKAVMVARLSREIEIYESDIAQLSDITGRDQSDNYKLAAWQQLAAGEATQSQHFSAMVRAQKQIIDTLLTGKSAASEEIKTILSEVSEIKEALLLAKTQTDMLRTDLTAL